MTLAAQPRIGLALSGGAARGIAHIGVLRALAEKNIKIDCIAGTSAGSLVGGAYASGLSLDEIEAIGHKLRWRDVGRMTVSRLGVQNSARLEDFLRALLPVNRFEDLKTSLAIIATDLRSGDPVVFRDQGDIAFAIRASCAIPGWYVPVVHEDGRQLLDGGLVAMIPTVFARELGADIVIAVDVNAEGATFLGPPQSVIGIILQSMLVVQRTVSAHQLREADVVVKPRVGHIRWDELNKSNELIKAGYEAGLESIEAIQQLIDTFIETNRRKWYQFGRRPAEKKPLTERA
ncbi:MAG TPA: patatin-like phospholipase family protein [Pyrinomonadaceae bacterium]|nr:patatin-like phospholipase family protein [Pyrinomonadaceae bacterium]